MATEILSDTAAALATAKTSTSARVRGPSYPALAIDEAIAKAKLFWDAEKRSPAPVAAAARHWGYTETSSSGKVVVAALLHYGLLEALGVNENRQVKLTGRALDILLDAEGSSKRLEAVREAVKTPKIFAELLAKWPPSELPSEQTMRFHLVRDRGFNEGSVASFLKDFRRSIAYARLDSQPSNESVAPVSAEATFGADAAKLKTIRVGDYVQWESNGVLQFAPPRQVIEFSEDGDYVFVEGSSTGIPADEIRLAPAPARDRDLRSNAASPITRAGPGVKQDTFSLDEGQVVLQFPAKISQESYEDLKDWIDLQLRKIKRSVEQPK